MKKNNKLLVIVLGPTCVGKTDLAIELAQHLSTEIISADSRQLYKEMKIGTAMPSPEQLNKVKHHFIGVKSIKDYYNASEFENDVIKLLDTLFKTNNIAIMVGGSGLYIDAVCRGIDDMPSVDEELRDTLIQKLEDEGIESLRLQLKTIDPKYYDKVDLKNQSRILRALEVCLMTGKPYSSFLTHTDKVRNFDILKIGLFREREELNRLIDLRVDKMIENGLINEAKDLYPHKHLNALNTVGYKEFFDYFDGLSSLEKAIENVKINTRKYAKRQLSWFRRDDSINWFYPEDKITILNLVATKKNELNSK